MIGFLDSTGNYYEGDKAVWSDQEVPQRPDPTYKWSGTEWVIDEEIFKTQEATQALAKLKEIDLKSIRSIREWLVSQENAPQFIKDYEAEAITERAKIK